MKIYLNNKQKVWQNILPYLTILGLITIMLSYQMIKHATLITSDAWVHFYRFYDSSMQLKTGNFSYFQTNYGFYHSGRIFNALYGPLFAYLNGGLLLICHNWFLYQIVIDYIVLLIAGIGMYKLCQKVNVGSVISLLLASIYLQFGIPISIFRFNWMAWGAALAPYVLIQAVNMVEDKDNPVHWFNLGVVMSLLAQIHLLSTVILAVTLIPFYLYALINSSNKKQVLLNLIKALGLTLVLTANIWGAFLLLYPTNHIALPNTFSLNTYALHLSKFASLHAHVSYSIALILALQIVYILFHFKESRLSTISTIVGFLILLVSSRVIPWDRIQSAYPKIGASFQFPYRLVLGAYPLMLLAFGITITHLIKKHGHLVNNYAIFFLILVLIQNFSFNFIANYKKTNSFLRSNKVVVMSNKHAITKNRKKIKYAIRHTNDDNLFKLVKHVEPDYLPYNKRASNMLYAKKIVNQQNKYTYSVKGSKLILRWNSKRNKYIYLPIVMYHQSQLIVNGKNQINNHKNNIMQPKVKVKRGSNIASLQFIIPIWFKLLLVITIGAWIFILVDIHYKRISYFVSREAMP